MNRQEELFWKKVDKKGPDECWIHKNEKCGKDRPYVMCNGIKGSASRVAWIISNGGEIPPREMVVMHTCDNGSCVNPAHLKLGTQVENMLDMREKDRGYKFEILKGEDHGMCKINREIAEKIREEYATGNISQTNVGKKYGIGQTHVGRILRREHWG